MCWGTGSDVDKLEPKVVSNIFSVFTAEVQASRRGQWSNVFLDDRYIRAGGGWHWPWGAELVLLLKLFPGGDEYYVVQGFWAQHFDKEGTEWLLNCFDQECPGLSVDRIHSA